MKNIVPRRKESTRHCEASSSFWVNLVSQKWHSYRNRKPFYWLLKVAEYLRLSALP